MKNNVCKELFAKLWKVLYACTSFDKCKSYKDIPANNILFSTKRYETKCFAQGIDKLAQ